ncbi:hypothetical protein Rmet_2563 [Cupriavidus metallidurans CH34]|uniref:Uncharacterized protein n=1 Tax=Cupriavidus metallidurans (strain ATCC 43123 / DSM 2839 / NBRC 102507 / CH34) TaxID=266264 RepID=Q1LK86_CUPMC|nr:hypothetical protein Rmet_2563 [Cupriavidus metallidurans CH34]AVA36623.1 hypothetical protein C3Z06_25405 [Cupriavidus metallidurans]QGS29698.1 hypothetical protein FOB83_12830 [Cupriavidus metallidurans]
MPSMFPVIPPMTRTSIRTTRTVEENLAMATMTAMPGPSGKPTLPKAGSAGLVVVRPVRASMLALWSIGSKAGHASHVRDTSRYLFGLFAPQQNIRCSAILRAVSFAL